MADKMKIGAGLSLDGEKEFKSAISGINKDLSVLGSEMGKVSNQFVGNKDSMESLTAKSEVYNKQIDEQKKKIAVMTEALANAKEQYGESSNKVKDWQISLNKAEAELSKTENALKSATEKADGLNRVDLDGFSRGLKSAGDIAGKMAIALGTAAVAAGAGIAAMAVSASGNADEILTMSKQTGLATDDLQKFKYASELIDVDLETLTGSMAKLTKNMGTAKGGTGAAAEAFKALNVSITDSNGQLRNNQDVFADSIDALGKMQNGTERDALAMQIFGKKAQDLNPLILGGADALKKYGEEAEAAGLILSEDALNNLGAFDDALQEFKSTVSSSGNVFATMFAGPMAVGLNAITGYIKELTAAFGEGGMSAVTQKMGEIVSNVFARLNEELPKIVTIGLSLVEKIVDGISQNLPVLVESATKIILTLVNSLITMLPQLLEMGVTVLVEVANGISKALPNLVPKIVEVVTKIVAVFAENAPAFIGAAVQIIGAIALGLIKAIPELLKAIPTLVEAFVNSWDNMGEKFRGIGGEIVKGIWEGIKNLEAWFGDKISDFFGGIVKKVKKTLGINSPSKVFAEIGGYMAEGLGEGFAASMVATTDKINSSVPTTVPGVAQTATTNTVDSGLLSAIASMLGGQRQSGATTLTIQIDGKTLAQQTYDYLQNEAKIRGTSLVYGV